MNDPVLVRIVHETNPRKYFPALFELEQQGRIRIVGLHRNSIVKETVRATLNERRALATSIKNIVEDVKLRLLIPFISGEVIILAFAPWDWRLVLYAPLRHRNRILYHTSWPYFEVGRTPRSYGFLDPVLKRLWRRILNHNAVTSIAVLDAPRLSLQRDLSVSACVIPHAVPAVFFHEAKVARRVDQGPLRVIFIGELSAKKGIPELLQINRLFSRELVRLTIVGDGPLRKVCEQSGVAGEIQFLGPVHDRYALAAELAQHDILILLSQRQRDWEELFGIVIAEAMAAGLGVIASEHVGPRSLLDHLGLHNLFHDDDAAGVTALITRLAKDLTFRGDFRRIHAQEARRYASDDVAEAWWTLISGDPKSALAVSL